MNINCLTCKFCFEDVCICKQSEHNKEEVTDLMSCKEWFMNNNNCDYCIWQRLTKEVKTICVNHMSPNCDKIVTDKDCCLYFCEEK